MTLANDTPGIERINDRITIMTRFIGATDTEIKDVLVDDKIYVAWASPSWLDRNLPTIIGLVFTHHDETHVGNGKWVKK